jgi:hypothetical protein
MRGEPVTHAGLAAFLGRQYGHDEDGNYFVQNGPQRVFVELDYTPWILRLSAENTLQTHTGEPVENIGGAAFDEEGSLLLEFSGGIALLCDRDLPALLGRLQLADGSVADDSALLDLMELAPGTPSALTLQWNNKPVPLGRLCRSEAPRRYGFVSSPASPLAP